jgi:acetolactate synthase-1/2/3 large subunit
MRAADLLVRCLEEEGVDRIFGIPGEENLDLVDALLDSSIELVVTKHEEGASLMAAVTGRLTGRPGVCLSTLGPGATNLVTGVAEAYLSGNPLIALTGQARTGTQHPRKQFIDLVSLFRPITKSSVGLSKAKDIPRIIAGSFDSSIEERPGPVHLELPEDLMKEEVEGSPLHRTRMHVAASGQEVEALRDMIMTSKRPMIITGRGVISQGASTQLRDFARRWNIPVAMSWMGAGLIPFDDPLSLHTVGLRNNDHMLRAFNESDLIMMISFDLMEFQPSFWNVGKRKRLANISPIVMEGDLTPDLQVIGALDLTMAELASNPVRRKNWTLDLRSDLHQRMDDLPPDRGRVKPQLVVRTVRDSLDREDIAISDVGAHLLWMMKLYPVYRENTLIASNGLIPMGFAVPAAIATKFVHPSRKVVSVCGDGGFMMTSCELETAVRMGTPFVAIVLNDSGYGLIEARQKRAFGRTHGVSFDNPDLVRYAESFGARGERASSASELAEVLMSCLDEEVPSVIDVPVDYGENAKLTS